MYNRFSEAPWFNEEFIKDKNITIVGIGNIGSWLALFLGRIGYKLTLIDYDTVESHNLGGQFFPQNLVGSKKVYVDNVLKGFGVKEIDILESKFNPNILISTDIIISCVDNMTTRKELFEFAKTSGAALFLDGRALAELFEVYCVDLENEEEKEKYNQYLYKEEEVPDAACNFKSTSHCGAACASFITNALNIRVANYILKDKIYYEYFLTKINMTTLEINNL